MRCLPEVDRTSLVPRAACVRDYRWEGGQRRCACFVVNLAAPVNLSEIYEFLLFQLMKQLV